MNHEYTKILFICHVYINNINRLYSYHFHIVSNISMPSSAGKVQSINYNGARFFLDRCLDVKAIHFNDESQNRENLPPPVVPPSTKRPPVALNSITARQTGKCLDFACFSKFLGRDLRQMDAFRCRTNKDCMSTHEKSTGGGKSQMICRKFSSLHSSMLRLNLLL